VSEPSAGDFEHNRPAVPRAVHSGPRERWRGAVTRTWDEIDARLHGWRLSAVPALAGTLSVATCSEVYVERRLDGAVVR